VLEQTFVIEHPECLAKSVPRDFEFFRQPRFTQALTRTELTSTDQPAQLLSGIARSVPVLTGHDDANNPRNRHFIHGPLLQ
jgi:hypothetical protein